MQMIYKAKDLHDAHGVRDLLARSGIMVHLADPASEVGPVAPGSIRVSVDNELVDAARRTIAAGYRGRKNL